MNENLLQLHEAIAVVLLSKANRTAPLEDISAEINTRKLYVRKDGNPVPPHQIMQRTFLSNGKYHHLFRFTKPNIVTLI